MESDIQRSDAERVVKRTRSDFTQGQSSKQFTSAQSVNKRRPPPRAVSQMKTPNKECDFCHRVHSGEYRWKTGGCFNCGKLDHKVKDCPVMKQNEAKPAEQKSKANARVFSLTRQGAETSEDVVTGTLMINSVPASVLFDCGASHSFISRRFAKVVNVLPEYLKDDYCVSIPDGRTLVSNVVYKSCWVDIDEEKLSVDLI